MSTETKYDVFISSKSEDYHLAEKVYDFLTAKGLSVFLASKILEKLGESEYASKIDEVLDNSTHLIVVSSKLDHINSKWVKYEWSLFSSDLKSGYRQGNLLTILSNSIELKNLPASLRHRQSFRLDAFQENIMGYLVTEDDERAKRLQQIREQIENLETRKFQIEQEISEQEKALSGLRNEKRIVEDKIENLRIERSHLLGYQHVDEKKKPKPEPKNPSLWKKIKGYLQTHKKVLTITISISMVVVLLIPTIGLLNRVDFSSPDLDTEAIQSRPSPGLIEQSDTISTQKISSSETTTYTVNGVSFDMVSVAGGTFTMGATSEQDSDEYNGKMPAHRVKPSATNKGKTSEQGSDADSDETPTHKVTLSDFMIGKTEVTQELWQAVMGSNPSRFKGDNLPVESVSYEDCEKFIEKLKSLTGQDFRLPTEAEWEYAARGGNKSKGYKYSGSNDIGSVAWYHSNSSSKTHAVATKSANELGLYDMTGNVWEWCYDYYDDYSSGSQTNPKGPSEGSTRVGRGGCLFNPAGGCRVSNRCDSNPDYRIYGQGLRLAL